MDRPQALRHVLRVLIGALLAFALYQVFDLPHGFWAIFTVLVVMQASIGGTVAASTDRMLGTVAGALVGGVAAALRPQTPLGLGIALAACVALTSYPAARRPTLKVAPVTSAIVLLSPVGGEDPFTAGMIRVLEIGLGGFIAVGVTLVVLPARAHRLVRDRVEHTVVLLAELLQRCLDRLGEMPGDAVMSEAALAPLHQEVRTALAGVETAMGEADRERATRLGGLAVPRSVLRALWRVRNDVVQVGRATSRPMAEGVVDRLLPAARNLLAAQEIYLRALGTSAPAPNAALDSARATFREAVEALRRERLTVDQTFDEVGRVFGLAFALEALHHDLRELGDRLDELARVAPGAPVA